MLRNGLARKLIDNIPAYMGGTGIFPEKGGHRVVVEIIPVQGHLVDYRNDEWDFKVGFKYQRRSNLKIRFNKANAEFRTHLKDYAAMLLDTYEWKVSTVGSVISMMSGILNHAVEHSMYEMFILIDTDDIIGAVEHMQAHSESRRSAYSHIMRFVEFIRKTQGIILPIDLDEIGRRMTILSDIYRSKRQRKHHKMIPDQFFDAIIQTTDKVMRDETQPFNMRMTAGMLLMNTQLGLRCLEILALEKDCIRDYRSGDGITRHYTVYNSIKPARADVEVIQVKSICTPLLYDTWSYMLDLRDKVPHSKESKFLYTLDHPTASGPICGEVPPVSRDSFINLYKNFYGKYMREYIEQDWKGIDRVMLNSKYDRSLYSIPTIHSFRVHFATSLYTQGFPLDMIESIMSHTPQSNCYDSYYAVEDTEARNAVRSSRPEQWNGVEPEDEFDTFLDTLED